MIKMFMEKTLQQLEYIYDNVIRCFKPFLVKKVLLNECILLYYIPLLDILAIG